MPIDFEKNPLDVVYTWVDGDWPGYADEVAHHAGRPVDRNPNRYRDNLDLLKYSLRSIEAFAPWLGRVFLLTARPQRPAWLKPDAPGLTVVHHDEVFEARHLPTFSSLGIECHLASILGISDRFLYFNDDMLIGRSLQLADILDEKGRARVHLERNRSVSTRAHPHPWRAAIGHSNELLDSAFGRVKARPLVRHAPVVMDKEHWREMEKRWPAAIESTRSARFRSGDAIAPDYLYPHFCLATGHAEAVPVAESYRTVSYIGLENRPSLMSLQFAFVDFLRPLFLTLNDGFGDSPDPRVVVRVRRFLESWFPKPSRYEVQ